VFRIQVFWRFGVGISGKILLEKQIGQRLQARSLAAWARVRFLDGTGRTGFQGGECFGFSKRLFQGVIEELTLFQRAENGIPPFVEFGELFEAIAMAATATSSRVPVASLR